MATIRKLRGKWQAMVRRKGIPPRCKSFALKAEAERWARDLEGQVDNSGHLPDTRIAERMTLAELLVRYRDEISPSKRSAVTEISRINAILRRDICHRTLAMLSSADLASYRDQRLETVASATVVRELNTISHALDTAQKDWGIHLARNPVKLVRRPALPKGRTRRLEGDEEQKLLAGCDGGRNTWMKSVIIIAIETAMRQGEILSLTWKNVDLDRKVAHLPMTKNGESRDVPLSSRAVETMKAILSREDRDADRVFPLTAQATRLCWEHLRVRVGMADLRFHDLRHEAVSRLFEKGFGVAEVSAISGHKEFRMLARYTHLRAEDLAVRLS